MLMLVFASIGIQGLQQGWHEFRPDLFFGDEGPLCAFERVGAGSIPSTV
jgi:hypothetical protein